MEFNAESRGVEGAETTKGFGIREALSEEGRVRSNAEGRDAKNAERLKKLEAERRCAPEWKPHLCSLRLQTLRYGMHNQASSSPFTTRSTPSFNSR